MSIINLLKKQNTNTETNEQKIETLSNQFFATKPFANWHSNRTNEQRKKLYHDYNGSTEKSSSWEKQALTNGYFGIGPEMLAKLALGRARKCEVECLTNKFDIFIPKKDSQSILSNEEINKYYPLHISPMTKKEQEEFDNSKNIFSGMQSYFRRNLNGDTPLVWDLRRGAILSAIAMINMGADDFNSTTKFTDSAFQISPSICLENQFSWYCCDDFITPFHPRNEFSDTTFSNPERHFKKFRNMNDILYAYGKLKQNGQNRLNEDAINLYKQHHLDEAKKMDQNFLKMDELASMNEKDRIKLFIANTMQVPFTISKQEKQKDKFLADLHQKER